MSQKFVDTKTAGSDGLGARWALPCQGAIGLPDASEARFCPTSRDPQITVPFRSTRQRQVKQGSSLHQSTSKTMLCRATTQRVLAPSAFLLQSKSLPNVDALHLQNASTLANGMPSLAAPCERFAAADGIKHRIG